MWKHKNFINLQLCAGETWVLNETLVISTLDVSFTVNFMSNGNSYSKMQWTDIALPTKPYYGFYDETGVYLETGTWTNDAYRTITFETTPSGDLLTWLQENGTKQPNPKLSTPTNVDISGTTVQWDEVANAKSYDVLVDGEVWENVPQPSSGNVISAGTYIFNESLTAPQSGNISAEIIAKGNSLTADNVYGSQIDIEGLTVLDNGYLTLNGTNDLIEWDLYYWQYQHKVAEEDYVTYTATDNTKLRTIIFENDQNADDTLYTWFNSNATKQ